VIEIKRIKTTNHKSLTTGKLKHPGKSSDVAPETEEASVGV